MPKSPTEPFKHRCVQDLAWAISSPPLISGTIAGTSWWGTEQLEQEYQIYLPQLQKLDDEPSELEAALKETRSHRLGHYFEALVAFWLQTTPSYELLLNRSPLRNQHKTLGEIDYLVRDLRTRKVIHIEVAVKFYLGKAGLNHMANWHGPGLKDRLDIKFNHLCHHQTQLSRKYPELVPYRVDEYACIVKGRLFYPPSVEAKTTFTHPNHLHGRWHSYPLDPPEGGISYRKLQKKDWLAPLEDIDQHRTEPLTTPPIEPACCIECSDNKENSRVFILPENFWANVQVHDSTAVPAQS